MVIYEFILQTKELSGHSFRAIVIGYSEERAKALALEQIPDHFNKELVTVEMVANFSVTQENVIFYDHVN